MVETTCPRCQRKFLTYPYRFKRNGRVFCSASCSHKKDHVLGYIEIGGRRAHMVAAEAALGRALPPRAVVHHANGDRFDNRNANLVICENQSYHEVLHVRLRVAQAGGNPNTHRRCSTCQQLVEINKMCLRRGKRGNECKRCIADRATIYRHRAMAARMEGVAS